MYWLYFVCWQIFLEQSSIIKKSWSWKHLSKETRLTHSALRFSVSTKHSINFLYLTNFFKRWKIILFLTFQDFITHLLMKNSRNRMSSSQVNLFLAFLMRLFRLIDQTTYCWQKSTKAVTFGADFTNRNKIYFSLQRNLVITLYQVWSKLVETLASLKNLLVFPSQ